MTQSSCKRDTKSKSHPSVKLASVRVFSCKHPLSVPTVCKSVVQEEFLLKTFAVEEEHVLTQERIMGQKGNLRALAGICEFH